MAENRKKLVLTVSDHPDFPVTNDCAVLSSYKLSKYVNTLFEQVFKDYTGCILYADQTRYQGSQGQNVINNSHPVQLELYFASEYPKHDDDDRKVAFEPITDSIKNKYGNGGEGKTHFLEYALGLNAAITQNKLCEITADAIDLIHPLLWGDVASRLSRDPKAKEFATKGVTVESMVPRQTHNFNNPSSQNMVYNVIRFVNIDVVLNVLFSELNDEYRYQVVPIRPLTQQMTGYVVPNSDQKWLFAVYRINQQNFYDMCNEIGQFNTVGGLNVYTESYFNNYR